MFIPHIWLPVPLVLILVAVAALPVVFAALFGMSRLTRARQVGAAAAPVDGPASTQLAACVANCESMLSVPEPVTAAPGVALKRPPLPTRATLVTVPLPDGVCQP